MQYTNQHFSIDLQPRADSVVLIMQVFNDNYYTDIFPGITSFLENHAPDVLKTTCYNPTNLPFSEEVVNTEMGHFFEHIVITYLYQDEILQGVQSPSYSATTEWNWNKYPAGSFKIKIDHVGSPQLLEKAIKKAMKTVELLFKNKIVN